MSILIGRSGQAKTLLSSAPRLLSRCLSSGTAMPRLEGKVAIVTASTDGIGLAIARRLAQDGAKVTVSSRKAHNVEKIVTQLSSEKLDVIGVPCHVGQAEQRQQLIQETISKRGKIDILVSNAAVNPVFGPLMENCDAAAWDKVFDVNVKASFLLAKEVYPHMRKQQKGSIVFVSSIAGYHPLPGLGAYSVSKTALLGLTKVLAKELGSYGIRVNCLAPGIVETKFSAALTKNDALRQGMEQQIALGRLSSPVEMSGVVSFLCSDDASYITGETIMATGGMPARL